MVTMAISPRNGLEALVFLCEAEAESLPPISEHGLYVGWLLPDDIPEPVRNSFHYALPDVLAGRRDVTRTELDPIS